jgi:hypothetical protein
MSTRRYSRESEPLTYLGYRIVIGERYLSVCDERGRELTSGRWSVSTARRLIRGYRRDDAKAQA